MQIRQLEDELGLPLFDKHARPLALTDAGRTYEAPGRKWTVLGFVRNIENKAVLVNGSPGALPGPLANSSNVGTGSFSGPRMYGVRVATDF